MKIDGWKEATIRYAAEKGIVTDEQNINDEEVNVRIITARSTILTDLCNDSNVGIISTANFSKFTVEYDESIQNSTKYTIYQVPQFINSRINYVGDSDFSCDSWRQRNELTIRNSISSQIPNVQTPFTIMGNELRVYNPSVKCDIGIIGLLNNPLEAPTFNPDKDEFPMDNNLAGKLNEYMFKTYFQYISNKRLDKVSDNTETPTA